MDIKELQQACEAGEPFELKLNWDMLKAEDDTETKGLFHYVDEKLVGFIGLYGFGNKVEVCGMVHPDFRRRGIFTQLYHEAAQVMNEKGYNKILLNAPANSESAKGFLNSISCSYSISEHQMKWEEKEMVQYDDVSLRLATPDDFELKVQLDVQCFGFKDGEAREYNQQKNRVEDENFIIMSGDQAVGKIRVSHYDGEAWIYGFAVLPEFQGQGIGRKALSNVVVKEHESGYPIFLEVEAENTNALRLYESCGFKAYHSQDYYELKK